jgi:ATP/maltotriose-dependent transcriptional regulator MalT/DNA-binding SARP family transcriptional activator
LVDLLYDLLEYKLILVVAPAGYGKTSLLIDFARTCDLTVCWYAIDQRENDFGLFLAHFIASIRRCHSKFGAVTSAFLQTSDPNSVDLEHLVTTIVNEIFETIDEHFGVVLDDYHLVGENERIADFISRFVQRVDENCHLILSSRKRLTIPELDLCVARSLVGMVSLEDLAFRPDEIQALVLQNYHQSVSDSESEKLACETEGWITGLLLSAQSPWKGMHSRLQTALVSGIGLYDFLANQVLNRQTPSIRNFLMHSAVLVEFGVDLCKAVLEPTLYPEETDWANLIETVLQNNVFVLTVGEEAPTYRYHTLFREFLEAQLELEHPGERNLILSRLAAFYADTGNYEKAYEIFHDIQDQASAVDLIEMAGSQMIKDGQFSALNRWLDELPHHVITSRPALLSLRGAVALMGQNIDQALPFFNQAELAFRTLGDITGLSRTLERRSVAYQFMGNYQAALADANEVLRLLDGDHLTSPIYAGVLKSRGVCYHSLGQLDEAAENLGKALAVYESLHDETNEVNVLRDLGMVYASRGEIEAAKDTYARALRFIRKNGDKARLASLLNNLGVFHHHAGEYPQAAQILNEGLKYARQTGYLRSEVYAFASIGDLYADLDALDAASSAYEKAYDLAQQLKHRFLMFYINLRRAAVAREQGDLVQARSYSSIAGEMMDSSSIYENGLLELESGMQAFHEVDIPVAVAKLEKALEWFRLGKLPAEQGRTHLHLAAVYHRMGQKATVGQHIALALEQSANLTNQNALIISGRKIVDLIESMQSDPQIKHDVSRLLKRVREFEWDLPGLRRKIRQQALAVPFAPPSLIIQAFAEMVVVINGKMMTLLEWKSMLQREIFFFLLTQPNGATKDIIADAVWRYEGDRKKFDNALYRLRKVVGNEVVLYQDNRYVFNRELDYTYYVEIFQEKARAAVKEQDPIERIEKYKEAVALYRGPYLLEAGGTWAIAERERLWLIFKDAALELGEYHLGHKEYKSCLDYCHRILEKEPGLEEAHRMAMRAHAATGNQSEVERQYQWCCRALLNYSGADPTPETKLLYQTLRRRK